MFIEAIKLRSESDRLWPKLQKKAYAAFELGRDFVWSVLEGGSMVRLVGPGQRPLERHEFEVRQNRYDWSSRG